MIRMRLERAGSKAARHDAHGGFSNRLRGLMVIGVAPATFSLGLHPLVQRRAQLDSKKPRQVIVGEFVDAHALELPERHELGNVHVPYLFPFRFRAPLVPASFSGGRN